MLFKKIRPRSTGEAGRWGDEGTLARFSATSIDECDESSISVAGRGLLGDRRLYFRREPQPGRRIHYHRRNLLHVPAERIPDGAGFLLGVGAAIDRRHCRRPEFSDAL